jgi:cell wall-associated NlpC family hydrolase
MGQRVDFNSNQIQTPNLLAITQLRQMDATGQVGSIPHVSTQVAAAAVTGGSPTGQAIAKTALSQLGQPYQYGGQAKLGHPTDCSGLLQAAAAAHGINIPRTTYTQWQTGKAVPTNALQPGDAVFFKGSDARGNLPGHVGIYIGGGKFVEDPHTGATVTISTLAGRSDYVGARRYV